MEKKPTDNQIKNLVSNEAIKKLKELAGKEKTCMFTTNLSILPLTSRPMATQDVDDSGNIWFLSQEHTNKIQEIEKDNRVQLFFSNTGNSEYLSVYGKASVLKDRAKVEELWNPIAKVWFKEGKDDPEVTIIKVQPAEIYYWDTRHNKTVALLKMLASTVSDKAMDDGVEGKLKI